MTITKMKHQEGTFLGAGDIELYYQSWYPHRSPHAIIVMVHGLGVHSNVFDCERGSRVDNTPRCGVDNMVGFFVKRDYAIYAFDLRGHGRSPGQRGYINSWSEFRGFTGFFTANYY